MISNAPEAVPATPAQFRSTFELTNDGQAVLAYLTQKFGGALWADSADERTRRIGHREVIEHIHFYLGREE